MRAWFVGAVSVGAWSGAMLAGCQPCEGPIVVTVAGADTYEVAWSGDDGATWSPCREGLAPDEWACGPEEDAAAGTYLVQVTVGDEVFEEAVDLGEPNGCTADARVLIDASASATGG